MTVFLGDGKYINLIVATIKIEGYYNIVALIVGNQCLFSMDTEAVR